MTMQNNLLSSSYSFISERLACASPTYLLNRASSTKAGALGALFPATRSTSQEEMEIATMPPSGATAQAAVLDPRLAGVWIKDISRSDSMAEAMGAMRLNRLMRAAIGLIRGVEVTGLEEGRFSFAVFSIIPWFKVRESYGLDGSVAQFNRRDLRWGKHSASAAVRSDGALVLSLKWGEPIAGEGTDVFQILLAGTTAAATLAAGSAGAGAGEQQGGDGGEGGSCSPVPHKDDVLLVTSTLRLGSGDTVREVVYKMVHTRKGR